MTYKFLVDHTLADGRAFHVNDTASDIPTDEAAVLVDAQIIVVDDSEGSGITLTGADREG